MKFTLAPDTLGSLGIDYEVLDQEIRVALDAGQVIRVLKAQRAHTLREVVSMLREIATDLEDNYFGNEALLRTAAKIAVEAAAKEATDEPTT